MSYLLHIETATPVCSIALSQDNQIIAKKESSEQNIHSESLTCFIEELMKLQSIDFHALSAISVSEGPGSYTGLRIGVSAAKGLCYALNIPLISVKTLHSLAYGMSQILKDESALYAPMLDARRMEVYSALYNFQGDEIETVNAKIIDSDSFSSILKNQKMVFGGPGSEKCKSTIRSNNAIFINDFQASAEWMISIGYQKFCSNNFEDTAYFEPFYLKTFEAGKPHVKGLK